MNLASRRRLRPSLHEDEPFAGDDILAILPLPIFYADLDGDRPLLTIANAAAAEEIGDRAAQGDTVEAHTVLLDDEVTVLARYLREAKIDDRPHQLHAHNPEKDEASGYMLRLKKVTTDTAIVAMIPADADPGIVVGRETLMAIGHELRTPLNSIIGFAEMMSQEFMGPLGSPEYREYANLIGNAGRSILERFNKETERERLNAIRRLDDYESIIELAPDMICICVGGRIEKINAAGIAMLGMWDDSTLVGRPLADFVLDEYKVIFDGDMGMLLGETEQVPTMFRRRDGAIIDAEINVLPFKPACDGQDGENAVILAARDVTERQRTIRTIIDREERLRRTMDTVSDAIMVTDEAGIIELANAAATDVFGANARSLLKRDLADLIDEDASEYTVADLLERARSLIDKTVHAYGVEMRGIRDNMTTFPMEVSVNTMTYEGRTVFIASIRDISERKAYEQELKRIASSEPLTGLPNRYTFERQLDIAVKDADQTGTPFTVMSVDLNAFKSINDALGHVFGDKVLRAAAQRIQDLLKDRGFLAHFGGDDFFILFRSARSREEIEDIAASVCEIMAMPLQVEDKEIFTSCTVGICDYPNDANDRVELMQHVDTVTHYAKKYFAGSYAFYTQPLSEQAQRRLDIERNLRRAIERNELSVLFQPKVDLNNRKVIGAEALMRWNSAELGFVPPDEFIIVAEQTGLIIDIGQWMIDQVCSYGATWMHEGLAPIHLGVNLSAVQFLHGDLDGSVRRALESSGFEPQLLDLELTESMMVENPERSIETLLEMKKMGITVSMDDFGTGYSALSLLTKFPLDNLKIDRAFVMNLPGDRDAATIARTIVSMAQQLNFTVVAEGIETENQMTYLSGLGCDIGQGYLFGKPMDFRELQSMVVGADD